MVHRLWLCLWSMPTRPSLEGKLVTRTRAGSRELVVECTSSCIAFVWTESIRRPRSTWVYQGPPSKFAPGTMHFAAEFFFIPACTTFVGGQSCLLMIRSSFTEVEHATRRLVRNRWIPSPEASQETCRKQRTQWTGVNRTWT